MFAVLFGLLAISARSNSSAGAVPFVGIAVHLVLFPVVAALPAPGWARAAGYGWLVIDIVANTASIGRTSTGSTGETPEPAEIRGGIGVNADAIRRGGHVVAALWIATASLQSGGALALAIIGIPLALILTIEALLHDWLPDWSLAPAMVLLIAWLVLVGVALR